ncbi:signal peptidase II [Helcococcus sueciensis]|uniref:signal peptidase II n=1 Tax=Helcococcus sueciensis TaxID=241555 RepID=UPI000413257F|nr:signal peptidase II [Helcococcus sueciensis]
MYAILFVILVAIDQVTKYIAIINLKGKNEVVIIDKWLHFTYVENSGAAFGIFQNATILFTILTIIIVFGIMWYMLKESNNIGIFLKFSLVMIIAGAIGNLIDRIRLGYVVDFIYSPLGGLYNFPVFNFADIYVTCSAILLIIYLLFIDGKDVKQ